MNKSLSRQLAQGAALIAEDRLAAAQLEAFLLSSDAAEREAVWHSPRISTQAAWAQDVWLRFADDDRSLLTGPQCAALWRRIVAESPEGHDLIDCDRVAEWAAAAWRQLWDWRIDYRTLRADTPDTAFAAFLRWAETFAGWTAQAGWIDAARLPAALAKPAVLGRLRGPRTLWVAPIVCKPALAHLVETLTDAGHAASLWAPAESRCTSWRAALGDRNDEVLAACRWAQQRLRDDPSQRLAIVVAPDGDTERLLERAFDSTVTAARGEIVPAYLDGRSLERDPAIGAALTCIALAGRHADFGVLSRWMRSPFLGEGIEDRPTRCRVEAELRSEPMAQLRFYAGYRRAGLRSWLERRVPQVVNVIDMIIAQREALPSLQTPTRWAAFFSELLTAMGWPGSGPRVPQGALDAWGEALSELARLSPIVGNIDLETAIAELGDIVGRHRLHAPAALRGVCVVPRIELVGCGYDAVWITGLSDRAWPRAAQPNPMLPLRLQIVHGMPLASPAGALSWSRDVMARLARSVPELICSYPSIEDDFSAAPSPLIRAFEALPDAVYPASSPAYARREGAVESVDDPAPPLAEDTVIGGATTLARQARCPLRAFVGGRLAAEPLETVARGFDARQRGIATHRALELLMTGIPSKAALEALSADERAARIRASSRQALRERARSAERELKVFIELEQKRLELLLAAMLSAELARSAFAVEGLEVKLVAQVAGRQITCRVDRIDRLQDGRVAVIDYKTGQRATPLDWLRSRLLEPQLPLYAHVAGEGVGALVLASLQATGFSYRGLWDVDGAFPARPQTLPSGTSWSQQQAHWSQQLTELLDEYVAGDTRISVADWEAVAGPLAPLTRVYEHLVLERESAETDGTS